jgi:secreted trypsin-like serine protease
VVDGEGRTGACAGDSGGPLLVADSSGQARVAGVLDRGSADCLGLDLYTRIDALADWIERVSALGAVGESKTHSCL